jgi:hypothetical protein
MTNLQLFNFQQKEVKIIISYDLSKGIYKGTDEKYYDVSRIDFKTVDGRTLPFRQGEGKWVCEARVLDSSDSWKWYSIVSEVDRYQ